METLNTLLNNYGEQEFIKELNLYLAYKLDISYLMN